MCYNATKMFDVLLENNYFWFVAILLSAVVFGELVSYFFKVYIKDLTKKTKNNLDDIVFSVISGPLHFIVWGVGLYFALGMLDLNDSQNLCKDRIFVILGVLISAILLSRISNALVTEILKSKNKVDKTPKVLNRLISVIVYVIATLMVLNVLGIEITPLIAALGVGGLAIGLALQDTLSNLFSGVYLASDKPISIGDYVKIGNEVEGYVEDIGWRTTKIRTLPNNFIVVPNAKIAESTIMNSSYETEEQSVLLDCGVDYGSDLDKVEKVTIDVATNIQKTTEGAVKDFEPFIRFHTFGKSNINFTIILRVKTFVDKYLIKHEMVKALKKRFDEEGIEISWPVRKIARIK